MEIEIPYKESHVGRHFRQKNGRTITQRKYHLTEEEIEKIRYNHMLYCNRYSDDINLKAGSVFFNPFRKGVSWIQIQALYELGCNEYHELRDIVKKIEYISKHIPVTDTTSIRKGVSNYLELFQTRVPRTSLDKAKGLIGKIESNYLSFQRLFDHHPIGYKLYQAGCCIDYKLVDNGIMTLSYYRLRTREEEYGLYPICDYSEYNKIDKKINNGKLPKKIIITSEGAYFNGEKI